MPHKVVKHGDRWLTIDTHTHQIRGRHATKSQAEQQRRVLASLQKKGKRK